MAKAWLAGFKGEENGVTFARSRSAAKHNAYCAAKDAGWENATVMSMHARRAPEFDGWED